MSYRFRMMQDYKKTFFNNFDGDCICIQIGRLLHYIFDDVVSKVLIGKFGDRVPFWFYSDFENRKHRNQIFLFTLTSIIVILQSRVINDTPAFLKGQNRPIYTGFNNCFKIEFGSL